MLSFVLHFKRKMCLVIEMSDLKKVVKFNNHGRIEITQGLMLPREALLRKLEIQINETYKDV